MVFFLIAMVFCPLGYGILLYSYGILPYSYGILPYRLWHPAL